MGSNDRNLGRMRVEMADVRTQSPYLEELMNHFTPIDAEYLADADQIRYIGYSPHFDEHVPRGCEAPLYEPWFYNAYGETHFLGFGKEPQNKNFVGVNEFHHPPTFE